MAYRALRREKQAEETLNRYLIDTVARQTLRIRDRPMKYEHMTKEQLIDKLMEMRQRTVDFEGLKTECEEAENAPAKLRKSNEALLAKVPRTRTRGKSCRNFTNWKENSV